ncbi:bacillithiol biosynthesis cysteine-adding enzyme BshC [Salsuginibacillus halophilus]|uniref:Putative cysteine ligase BshC n=1 Tax=Salsuginibacillus halophilus TaxID=517424 RepID=A0A2P8HX28_9BACI|nr:bacillithiol biosynthesis cysteine-adding enzyme BshC [Salsuginibacillus halophilus]PSL50780.1 bacillithiol biosynthesis cysteine-adding enzyme BshC [Salsuginibacillus halophilus]
MELQDAPNIDAQSFAVDYRSGNRKARELFDYAPFDQDVERLEELDRRSFNRDQLADVLIKMQKRYFYHQKALEEAKRLKDPKSVCVITGQQPGLLGGPLYTLAKAVSTIVEAKRKESELKRPVIPIFWIAGEDHDYEEIHHTYAPGEKRVNKLTYQGPREHRAPLSEQPISSDEMKKWLQDVFLHVRETDETKTLYTNLAALAERSASVSDYFGEVMRYFFQNEGLVMFDAHDHDVRHLEQPLFEKLVQHVEVVQSAFQQGKEALRQSGYENPLALDQAHSHLFYVVQGERWPLIYRKDEVPSFLTKKGTLRFHKGELLTLVKQTPEAFSTNVFTRPLMQDWLFPVLSYVGGPGEIHYWAVLKPLFHAFGCKVPPVMPRKEFWWVHRRINRILTDEEITLSEAAKGGLKNRVTEIEQSAITVDGPALSREARAQTASVIGAVLKELEAQGPAFKAKAEKKRSELETWFSELGDTINEAQKMQTAHRIAKLKEVELHLFPLDGSQERFFNSVYVLNELGVDGISRLIARIKADDGVRKVVHL